MFAKLFGFKKDDKKDVTSLPQGTHFFTHKFLIVFAVDISLLTEKQVSQWLTINNLKDCVDAFAKNAISGAELVSLSVSDLETLGVKKLA